MRPHIAARDEGSAVWTPLPAGSRGNHGLHASGRLSHSRMQKTGGAGRWRRGGPGKQDQYKQGCDKQNYGRQNWRRCVWGARGGGGGGEAAAHGQLCALNRAAQLSTKNSQATFPPAGLLATRCSTCRPAPGQLAAAPRSGAAASWRQHHCVRIMM